MLIFGAQEYVDQRALVDFVVEPPPADQPLLRDWPLNLVWLHRPVTFSDTITRQFKGENPMHDSDPFRVPVREPKPGTFHRPAHGFGIKFEPRPTELKLSGAKTGEQELGQGVMHLPLSGANPSTKDEAP